MNIPNPIYLLISDTTFQIAFSKIYSLYVIYKMLSNWYGTDKNY